VVCAVDGRRRFLLGSAFDCITGCFSAQSSPVSTAASLEATVVSAAGVGGSENGVVVVAVTAVGSPRSLEAESFKDPGVWVSEAELFEDPEA